jgi:teichuronic acid biosynthesis glycosyltransferase TuaG
MNELISVIIPTYNRYGFLLRAILSVQRQTYCNLEIIVVNDCSTDSNYYSGELERMRCRDPRLIIIHLPQNQRKVYQTSAAQGKTRQYGLNISRGKWVAFLDDDDCWCPMKLERQINFLRQHPEYKMCSTNMMIINMEGTPIRPYLTQSIPMTLTLEMIQQTNYINNSTVLIEKELCNRVGEFNIGHSEDWDYWLRALRYTHCGYLPELLVFYTMDAQNIKNYK